MLISNSAKNKPSALDYEWYRLAEDLRPFPRTLKGYQDDFKRGKVIGMRIYRKKLQVMFPDLERVTLDTKLYNRLIKIVKPYKGKIDNKKVPTGTVPSKAKAKRKGKTKDSQFDEYIDAQIRTINIVGANLDSSFVYLFTDKGMSAEVYHYYDVSRLLNHYRRDKRIAATQRGDFDRVMKRELKKKLPFAVCDSGLTNFEGRPISAISIAVEYASN